MRLTKDFQEILLMRLGRDSQEIFKRNNLNSVSLRYSNECFIEMAMLWKCSPIADSFNLYLFHHHRRVKVRTYILTQIHIISSSFDLSSFNNSCTYVPPKLLSGVLQCVLLATACLCHRLHWWHHLLAGPLHWHSAEVCFHGKLPCAV